MSGNCQALPGVSDGNALHWGKRPDSSSKKEGDVKRLESALTLMFCLPQMWFALLVAAVAFIVSYWDPLVKIVDYAIRLLSES